MGIDYKSLGMRSESKWVIKSKAVGGLLTTYKEKVTTPVRQPILTPEEAMVLKDEKWVVIPKDFKMYGEFMCKAGGRRFFCAIDPSAANEKAPDKNDGQREKPARRVAARRSSAK